MRPAQLAALAVPASLLAIQAAPALSGTGLGRKIFPCVTNVPGSRSVGLTFDDGPDHCLDHFLKELDRLGAKATFFLMAEQVERWPGAPGEIVAAGHEVAVHGYNHRGHIRRTPRDLQDDLRRARAIIEDAAGCETTLYRAPYGVFSFGSWRETSAQGWTRVLWSRWGKDWEEQATPQRIADLIGRPVAGDILLLHDSDRYSAPNSWRNTLGALPIIMERIEQAGLKAKTVTELMQEAAKSRNASDGR
jgi:peptidoglycan-N-acetylglucosamine deacetylase